MIENPVKISLVNYTNTIPFVFGLQKFFTDKEITLVPDNPAECAEKLKNGETDLGLIPVAMLKLLPNNCIVTDFCIGAEKKVDSVMLYSHVPLHSIREIILDYQSRTSVELVKILCREYWGINPHFKSGYPGFEKVIEHHTAGVIIGDRTFSTADQFPFAFDLAEAWNNMTGLPFVFACWITPGNLSSDFLQKFNSALKFGVEHTKNAIQIIGSRNLTDKDCLFYLTQRISYQLTPTKKKALNLFLEKMEMK